MRFIAAIAPLWLAGCALGIPDADPPVPKVKPCQKIVIMQPENRAYCMTNEEFERWLKRNLPGSF
jgi:hypothetical protein